MSSRRLNSDMPKRRFAALLPLIAVLVLSSLPHGSLAFQQVSSVRFQPSLTQKKPFLGATFGDNDAESSIEGSSDRGMKLDWPKTKEQISEFWEMAYPYFEESSAGRWLFAGMLALTLTNSGVSVAFSYLGKDFWNALSSKDTVEFYNVLSKYVGALLVGAPLVTLYKFQRERLAVHWREWMTDRTLQLYQENRVYYFLERGREVDNPDQRIAEDVKSFTSFSLQLFLTIVTSIIDLVSFSLILYSIYPQLFVAIVGYAVFGTVTTAILGKDLVRFNYDQLSKEADFRYSLVRLRDNAESIAFYAGEDVEGRAISDRLKKVIENSRGLIGAQRNLEFFTNGYRFLIVLLPAAVVAPRYFAGAIELGVISQSVGAFNHILSDLSIVVNEFEQLSRFSAGIERLSVFLGTMRSVDPQRGDDKDFPLLQLANQTLNEDAISTVQATIQASSNEEIGKISLHHVESSSNSPLLQLENLDLCTPDKKRFLIRNLNMKLLEGENMMIVGNSGAGKSSLLRAIAGLWSDGNGQISTPMNDDVYFLPQRPYCALGSLKDQLLYPSLEDVEAEDYPEGHKVSRSHILKQSLTDEDLLEVLDKVDLGQLAARAGDGDPIRGLQTTLDWSNTLSFGEQQRLAFGRVLVNQPRLVILDEATSALDMVAEARMYTLLRDMGKKTLSGNGQLSRPGLTYISVGHRPSLLSYHDVRLRLSGEEGYSFEQIDKTKMDMQSALKSISNL